MDVLDGIRAISILLVLWFHFWQQTWLMPAYSTPFLKWLGISSVTFDIVRRAGYLFVDMMILVSAFSLFLPHARTMIIGAPAPSIKQFYRKRAARILPSYLLCVIVLFIIALCQGSYSSDTVMLRDLISHLTFTQMFWIDSYIFTNLGVVLWTVAVLVMFYVIFPWVAIAFRRLHIVVYIVMVGLGLGATYLMASIGSDMTMYVNQFPTFLPVFANGMGAAYLYVWFAKKCRWRKLLSPLFTVLAILMVVIMCEMMSDCVSAYPESQKWQMLYRYPLSLVFTGFILFSAFAIKPYRMIFSNAVAKSLAAISFNLYIWHQWIMVQLRSGLGFAHGGDVSKAGANAQIALTITGLVVSIIVAVIITYCVEKPMSKLILNNGRRKENASEIQNKGNLLNGDKL